MRLRIVVCEYWQMTEAQQKTLLSEEEEYMKDQGELLMFRLFAEGIEDLYIDMIENFVKKPPALNLQ